MPDSSVTQQLASLSRLSTPTLCGLWCQIFKREPTSTMRRELILRIIAYRLQEQEFGALSEGSCRRLRQLASALEANPNAAISTRPPIKPGTRLVREWKHQVHVVEAEAKGYQYKGARYASLSEIARLITGTRWSGPLFFGLKTKQSSESMEIL
jgi:hypothetical protein